MNSACCVWDFTLSEAAASELDIKKEIEKISKKWCFQLEESESGYLHYQGRVSLKEKSRKPFKPWFELHWSVTSTENKDNDFYACKEESRIKGPWKDTDENIYIPRQIREVKKLYPWQEKVIEISKEWDTRKINLIYEPKGNTGKTFIKGYMRAHGLARPIPFVNDYKDLMRMIYCLPTSTCYIIDIPKAINKDRLFQMYAGIETIKDGYAYDDRYTFKEKVFDCPCIWVFTNMEPDMELLSFDRWRVWLINDEKELN